MVGALALVAAGIGAGAPSFPTGSDTLASSGQAISSTASLVDVDGDSDVDISEPIDPQVLEEQTATQAEQAMQAQADLTERAQAAADELESNQWVLPVTGYRLSARFGQSSSMWSSSHTGLDLAGPSGSTIVSMTAGTVTEAGYDGAYGNKTVVTLEDGTEIWYAHQSRIAVSAGDTVDPGEEIGYTGATGNVTGPHLHVEVRPGGGEPVDPLGALAEHGVDP